MHNKFKHLISTSLCVLCFLTIAFLAYGQEAIQLNVLKYNENISVIEGVSNTTVLTGQDGVFIVDTQIQEISNQLISKITEISHQPVHFIVNTHSHFDHVGGNDKAADTNAIIISHENVRKLMGAEQRHDMINATTPPASKAALPVITFTKDLTLNINGEEVHVFHLGPGHTNGDAIVHFRNANVIVLGDLYFNGFYPYIGIEGGGSINNMIQVGNVLLEMIDENTTIIPGHGPIAKKANYTEYLSMLTSIRDIIRIQIEAGKSLKEMIASKPLKAFDEKWGKGPLFTSDQFAELVYMDLSRK